MATLVQQTAELFADNTSSIAPSITGVTAGNTVVMLVACSQSGTNTALTAPAGWSTAISTTGPTTNTFRQQVAVFYKENASSGSHSGTVTFANNSFAAAIICEFSGLKTSGAYDASASQNGTATTSASTTSATNTDANALVLAVLCVSSDAGVVTGLSTPASSGYTNINGELDETAHTAYQFSYKNVSSSASQSGAWTWTNNGQYGAAVVIFSDAPATPVITAQPTDQTANNGATATFSVTATGATSYQWQDNSSGSFADISGATSSSYAPTATYSMQGRLYRCVVTNAGGSVNSNSAALYVAWNLTGTGPRAFPDLGGMIGGGTVDSVLLGTLSAGGGATVNGQTLTVTASVIAGSVTAASTVSGQTATSTASVIAGAVQAAATVSGQVVNATASLIAGAVTAAATVNGQTATVNASVLAGTASGGGAVVVNGQTVTSTASVIAGSVTAAALVDAQVITVVASAIAGTVQAAATIAGQLLTSTASVIAGAVTAAADVAGQTLTVNASVLAGTASGGGAATVNGQTITATASVIAGAVTGAAVVDGQLLTVNASVIAGGAFVPSGDATLQSKALRTGIGMGL